MEDDQADVKIEAGEEASIPEPSTEEVQATEEADTQPVETEPTGEVEAEETPAESEAPKKGAQARIRELAKQKKSAESRASTAEERAKSLEERIAALTTPVGAAPQGQFTPQIDPGQDVTPEQYRDHVLGTASAMVELKIKQSEAINRINNETGEVVRLYPQLDPSSDEYDPELSDAVTEATEAHIRQNPYSASPKKFVEKLMRPYKRSVTKEVGKETANIAKQVAESAARPTAVTVKSGKSDAEKTLAELEQELGFYN